MQPSNRQLASCTQLGQLGGGLSGTHRAGILPGEAGSSERLNCAAMRTRYCKDGIACIQDKKKPVSAASRRRGR